MMYVAQNGLSMNTKRQSSRVASSPVSSIVKNLIKIVLIQFLVNYTSAFGPLNMGMVIINYLLIATKFIQFCLKYVCGFSMHNILQTSNTCERL